MKIGFDAGGLFGQGGIDRYARELLRHIVAIDSVHEFVALTRTSCVELVHEIVAGGKNVEVRAGLQHDMMLGPLLTRITQQMQRRHWLRTMHDVDLVHITNHWRWRPPMPPHYVVTVHDLFPLTMDNISDAKQRNRFAGFVDGLAPDASMILTPSDYVAKTLAERYPEKASFIRTTPLAAGDAFTPTPASPELLARAGVAPGERYLLFVGRVDDRKNIERMLGAFLTIPEADRKGVLFVLALSGLREHIAKFKIDNTTILQASGIRVIHDLSTLDIVMLFSSARALAFVSIAEGFGLPVLEAMRCGCPVLTSNTTSLPEVAGDAALLVNPYDQDAIRDAMLRLVQDDALLKDLMLRGFERAKKFSWENTAALTMQAYEEVFV